MKSLFENWRNYLEEASLINEEFYFLDDEGYENPLSLTITRFLSSRLPGSPSAKKLSDLQASGAEGMVISLDDNRVIKLFHSLDNAVKNLPLVSKNMPETAQVFSTGKIILDQPVIYFKKGSSYSPTDVEPTKNIYYIVMQRVEPDPYVYRYPELAYEAYNRLSNMDLLKLIDLYQLEIPEINEKIDNIYKDFSSSSDTLEQFLSQASKRQRNVAIQEFNIYRKSKTKDFIVPATLKKLILNYLGIKSDIPYAQKLIQYLLSKKEFLKKPKKSFTGNTIAEDLISVIELVKNIRIEKKVPWNDIHREQFGRNKNNELVALDLGIKKGELTPHDRSAFDKNVSKLSTRGKEKKLVNESNFEDVNRTGVKILNVYDFDRTLFFTDGPEEGKVKYEKVFGIPYPHVGWIGREESLRDELDIPKNRQMELIYNTLKREPNSMSVLISNRVYKLQGRLTQFLSDRGFTFDDVLLKKGGQTKVQRLEAVWENNQDIEKINIFDDLDEAIESYKQIRDLYKLWRPELEINIYQVYPDKILKV